MGNTKQARDEQAQREALLKMALRPVVGEQVAELDAQVADLRQRIEWIEQSRSPRG